MKTISKTYNIFEYSELSESAKQKARDWYQSVSQYDEWWESTYSDASDIGLKIRGFDCSCGSIRAEFTKDILEVISLILKNHGKDCETYKIAEQYEKERAEFLELTLDDDYCDKEDEFVEKNEDNFLNDLKSEYLSILNKEYEYINSEEAISENIRANEYTFNEFGFRMD